MPNRAVKTNAMRILDSLGITYGVYTYQWDEEHLNAEYVAVLLNLPPETVCKTIVMRDDKNGIHVFVVPAPYEISYKKARAVTQSNEIQLVKTDELRTLTGYVRGGCSPLGMIKVYPVYIEETVQLQPTICISAGLRGWQLQISSIDLARATGGKFVDIV